MVSKPELIKDIWTPSVRIHAGFHHPNSWIGYEGDWSKNDLFEWIDDKALPVVVEMGEGTMKYIFDDKVTTLFLVNAGSDSEAALGVMETFCNNNKAFTCGQVSKQNPMFEPFTSFLGPAHEVTTSHLILLETKKMKMYRYKRVVADITGKQFVMQINYSRSG